MLLRWTWLVRRGSERVNNVCVCVCVLRMSDARNKKQGNTKEPQFLFIMSTSVCSSIQQQQTTVLVPSKAATMLRTKEENLPPTAALFSHSKQKDTLCVWCRQQISNESTCSVRTRSFGSALIGLRRTLSLPAAGGHANHYEAAAGLQT